MPYYAPPSAGSSITPNVVYAECNTPDDGTQVTGYLWDKFYDKASVEITAGANTVAALAAIGLTYAAGVFTPTANGVWSLRCELTVEASPGGDDTVKIDQQSFLDGPQILIEEPNTLGFTFLEMVLMAETGGTFALTSSCAGGTDLPFTYASMAIARLV